MPFFDLGAARLYYEEQGEGKPIVFIHGVWMSSRFFKKQIPYFGQRYRVIAVDLRGHGRSSQVHSGHTIATYASDIHALIKGLGLNGVTLVGWSMGAFVIWDYFRQFGPENVKATVIVDESASDFKWPDWPLGAFDIAELTGAMRTIQTDRAAFVQEFIPLMFNNPLAKEDYDWVFDEITRMPESIASAILFDQTMQDYRPVLPKVTVPTLLCFGGRDKLVSLQAAEHLQRNLPDARLVVLGNSGHCPFLEEADRFNHEVDQFIQSLAFVSH